MPTRPKEIIVLAGIPGAGKSCLAVHVANQHEFFYVSLNGEDKPSPEDRYRNQIWDAYNKSWGTRDATGLLRMLRRAPRDRVVVEWGFPVGTPAQRAISLDLARQMRDGRARFVWLECENELALERYLRTGKLKEAFEIQVLAIRANYNEIMDATEPQVIQVLGEDSADRASEEMYQEISSS